MCGAAVGCSNIAYPKLVVELMPSGKWVGRRGHLLLYRTLLQPRAALEVHHGSDVGEIPWMVWVGSMWGTTHVGPPRVTPEVMGVGVGNPEAVEGLSIPVCPQNVFLFQWRFQHVPEEGEA